MRGLAVDARTGKQLGRFSPLMAGTVSAGARTLLGRKMLGQGFSPLMAGTVSAGFEFCENYTGTQYRFSPLIAGTVSAGVS